MASGRGEIRPAFEIGLAGEHDGRRAGAIGDDPRTPRNHQQVVRGAAEDSGAGLQRERRRRLVVAADGHPVRQLVDVAGVEQQVRRDRAGELADALAADAPCGRRSAGGAAEARLRGHAHRARIGPAGGPVVGAERADVVRSVEERVGDGHRIHPAAVLGNVHGAGEVVGDGVVVVPLVHARAGEAHALDDQLAAEQAAAGAVDAQAAIGAAYEAVAEPEPRAAAKAQRPFVGLAAYGHVGDGGIGAGLGILVALAVVRFYGVVGGVRLLDVEVLDAPGPAVRPVQRVVGVAGEHDVLGVHRAAEELHAVVQVVVDLHVLDGGGGADRLEGDAVELVLLIDVGAGEADAQVAQNAGVVVRVAAAEEPRAGLALLGAVRGAAGHPFRAVVDGRVAVDHQPAPQAAAVGLHVVHHFGLRGEHDGLLGSALGHERAALLDHQEIFVRRADDRRPGSDRQLAVRQTAAAAPRRAGRRRHAQGAAGNLEHHVVAEHHAGRIDGAAVEAADVDGVDGATAEGRAGRFAGIRDDVHEAWGNDRGHRGAVVVAAIAAAAIVAVVPTTASAAASAAAASNRHFDNHGARRGVLGRTAAGAEQQRHAGDNAQPPQV